MEQVRTATFETVRPSGELSYELTPGDGDVVGVGMPIIVRFRQPVLERRRVERLLTVTSAVPIVGAWHWMSDREVHFRPEHPWPAGDQVVVVASLAGLDVGDGVWATTDHRVRFALGDAHVTTVETARHTMTVTKNGRVVAVVPQSAGSPRYPTMSGVHVVLGTQADVLMDSATNGIPRDAPDGYYEHVVWDVAISEHGEYVHAAPWSLSAQGRDNVSHGCVNLSPTNAAWFYAFSQRGDLIDVVGTPRPPGDDLATVDWNQTWSQWQAGSVLARRPHPGVA